LDDPNRHVGTHIDADLAFHLLLCELSRNLGWSTPGATWRVEYASPFWATATTTGRGSRQSVSPPIVNAIEVGDAAQVVTVVQDT
jgi:DNA-binding FadR family transcriptional regulator